ncbi:MAG: cation:dicarboxylase symporter family transporter, partial [Frankiaceae bacterium]|nr:cation:dicarboxylase symporter family transporter [Arenimonas sp.]
LLLFVVVLLLAAVFGELAVEGFLALWPIPADAAEALRASLASSAPTVPAVAPLPEWLAAIIPTNPVKAAAEGEMLPLVLFALLFGFAITQLARERAVGLVNFFEAIVEAMMVIVHWVILVAPIGVFALAYVVGARVGLGIAGALAHYLVLLVVVQVVLIALIYPMVVLSTKIPLATFARAVAPAQAVATSTQSSLASLPAMIESTRQMGIAPPVTALVMPLAVSVFRFTSPVANLAVVLYSASLFGVQLGMVHYAIGAVIALLMSLASVGLPGQVSFFASIAPICLAMGVPVGMLPLLLAVESIPDIFRTIGNVTADVAITAVLAGDAIGVPETDS